MMSSIDDRWCDLVPRWGLAARNPYNLFHTSICRIQHQCRRRRKYCRRCLIVVALYWATCMNRHKRKRFSEAAGTMKATEEAMEKNSPTTKKSTSARNPYNRDPKDTKSIRRQNRRLRRRNWPQMNTKHNRLSTLPQMVAEGKEEGAIEVVAAASML